MSASTTTNMEMRNGTRCHGMRFAVFSRGCRDCFLASRHITAPIITAPAEHRHTIHMSSPMYEEMISRTVHTPSPVTPTARAGTFRIVTSSSLARSGSFSFLRKMRKSSVNDVTAANTVGRAIMRTYSMNSTPK